MSLSFAFEEMESLPPGCGQLLLHHSGLVMGGRWAGTSLATGDNAVQGLLLFLTPTAFSRGSPEPLAALTTVAQMLAASVCSAGLFQRERKGRDEGESDSGNVGTGLLPPPAAPPLWECPEGEGPFSLCPVLQVPTQCLARKELREHWVPWLWGLMGLPSPLGDAVSQGWQGLWVTQVGI